MRSSACLARSGACLLLAALLLTGCGDAIKGPASAVGRLANLGAGPEPAPPPPIPEEERDIFCPRIVVQPDTEALRREDASAGADGLRWQASITETARECERAGTGVTVRVGVAGRVVRGPRGSERAVTLPVRVAVREAGRTSHSELKSVPVTLEDVSADWAVVADGIAIAEPRQSVIYVGFDG